MDNLRKFKHHVFSFLRHSVQPNNKFEKIETILLNLRFIPTFSERVWLTFKKDRFEVLIVVCSVWFENCATCFSKSFWVKVASLTWKWSTWPSIYNRRTKHINSNRVQQQKGSVIESTFRFTAVYFPMRHKQKWWSPSVRRLFSNNMYTSIKS